MLPTQAPALALICGPALRGRKSLSSNSPRGGSTWRSPRDPVQGPYWAVGRNASYLRHGQGILTSHSRPSLWEPSEAAPSCEGSSFQAAAWYCNAISLPLGGCRHSILYSYPLCLRKPFRGQAQTRPASHPSGDPALDAVGSMTESQRDKAARTAWRRSPFLAGKGKMAACALSHHDDPNVLCSAQQSVPCRRPNSRSGREVSG